MIRTAGVKSQSTNLTKTSVIAKTTQQPTTTSNEPINVNSYYSSSKEDMSVYDDVNNNRLNLRNTIPIYQETSSNIKGPPSAQDSSELTTTPPTTISPSETSNSYIQINEFIASDHLFGSVAGTTKLPIDSSHGEEDRTNKMDANKRYAK